MGGQRPAHTDVLCVLGPRGTPLGGSFQVSAGREDSPRALPRWLRTDLDEYASYASVMQLYALLYAEEMTHEDVKLSRLATP